MKKKHTYQAVSVQQVRVAELLAMLVTGCIVAVDVAKAKMLVGLATLSGEVMKLFRFTHPTETAEFLRIVTELRAGAAGGTVQVAMEPTGTYGDALRHKLWELGVSVFMVSPKRTHDSAELFDNVPSMHDGKSAVLIAKLHSMGLSTKWEPVPPTRRRLRALVNLRGHELDRESVCHGELEALLARHWPELGEAMDVRAQRSALQLLVKYPSPARVTSDPEGVRLLLKGASHGGLSEEVAENVIVGARGSLGVPMEPEEDRLVQALASQMLEAGTRMVQLEREMVTVGCNDEVYERLRKWMGTFTAAGLMTLCPPEQYATARQLEKACGLALREKSSGEHKGRLSITKRGPGLVRRLMFLFALRMIVADAMVRAWYEGRKSYSEASKKRAVVAVMRKLVRAAFHVAKGEPFDPSKLFDARRLNLGGAREPNVVQDVQEPSAAQEPTREQLAPEPSVAPPSVMQESAVQLAPPSNLLSAAKARASVKPSRAPRPKSHAMPKSAVTSAINATSAPPSGAQEPTRAQVAPEPSAASHSSVVQSSVVQLSPKLSVSGKASRASRATMPKSRATAAIPATSAPDREPRQVPAERPTTMEDVVAAARAACERVAAYRSSSRSARSTKEARDST